MEADWFHIDPEEYVELVGNRTQVIWLGRFMHHELLKLIFQVNGIQTRACRLHSEGDWMGFIDSCYSLACMNGKDNWESISGQKQRFRE